MWKVLSSRVFWFDFLGERSECKGYLKIRGAIVVHLYSGRKGRGQIIIKYFITAGDLTCVLSQ